MGEREETFECSVCDEVHFVVAELEMGELAESGKNGWWKIVHGVGGQIELVERRATHFGRSGAGRCAEVETDQVVNAIVGEVEVPQRCQRA